MTQEFWIRNSKTRSLWHRSNAFARECADFLKAQEFPKETFRSRLWPGRWQPLLSELGYLVTAVDYSLKPLLQSKTRISLLSSKTSVLWIFPGIALILFLSFSFSLFKIGWITKTFSSNPPPSRAFRFFFLPWKRKMIKTMAKAKNRWWNFCS